ncbi:MAG: alpha-L-rhamnosidase N-terminal domain-containing protein, partial [Clostridia bacterium]|nr:alpha-L-rhamnosidase N-terminal domain-containing protein [Clostridia bacterium]
MEQRFEISLEALPSYEAQGFCADGVSFERDGAKYIHVHKNDVFDAAALLCFDPQDSAVLTRTVFEADDVKKAALTVTALGYFTPYINGSLLTEDLLIPPKTDYNARDLTQTSFPTTDKLSHRVYYYEYDILPFLQTGKNVFAAHIGAGWYADNKNPAERMPKWGEMGLIFKITLTDANGNTRVIGSAAENTVWQKSYIRSTSLYYGEFHDYSFFDAEWNKPDFD